MELTNAFGMLLCFNGDNVNDREKYVASVKALCATEHEEDKYSKVTGNVIIWPEFTLHVNYFHCELLMLMLKVLKIKIGPTC